MFRLVRVIIRLSFEPRLRCTINSAHFGIPKVYMVYMAMPYKLLGSQNVHC